MAVRAGNNPIRLYSSKYGFKLLAVFIFSLLVYACKKSKPSEVVTEEVVPPEYELTFVANLNFIKNLSGSYDTTVNLSNGVSKHYKVSQKYYSLDNPTATCNNHLVGISYFDPPNKLAMVSPSCVWKSNSSEFGDLIYDDKNQFPSFTDNNWWSNDSINGNADCTFDFSSFKNYGGITIQVYNYASQQDEIQNLGYVQGISSYKFFKNFFQNNKGLNKFFILVSNDKSIEINGHKTYFSKTITFTFNCKVY